jgi:hypothetical protein
MKESAELDPLKEYRKHRAAVAAHLEMLHQHQQEWREQLELLRQKRHYLKALQQVTKTRRQELQWNWNKYQ